MKTRLLLLLAVGLFTATFDAACAQPVTQRVGICDPTPYSTPNCLKPQADGSLNVNATASISGFTPNGTNGTAIAATTTSASQALPGSSAVVNFFNDGANTAYLRLGIGSATATVADIPIPPNSGCALVVGSNTFAGAITASGTANIRQNGGSGLGSFCYGGGGSGGSGGAVTNAGTFAVQLTGATNNINNVSGTVSLPTGASTAAIQSETHGTVAAGTAASKAEAVGGIYNSSPITLTNGQGSALQLDASGYTKVNIAAGNGSAQGAAIAGQTPSTIACQVLTSGPSVYTTATTNPVNCDEYGAVLTHPYALQDRLVKGTTSAMTGTTSTSLVGAPGAGLKNYITTLSCVNSHATVGTFVTVQDGSGGTAIWTVAAAALFGGTAITFPAPLQQPTANTALYVADVTTGANVICSASGYKAP